MRAPFSFGVFFSKPLRNARAAKKEARLPVLKTYKLFIGDKFIRSESGQGRAGRVVANYARASCKDLRDAVTAARGASGAWSKQSAYLRGQILYRAAEMLEMRRPELEAELKRAAGRRKRSAVRLVFALAKSKADQALAPNELARANLNWFCAQINWSSKASLRILRCLTPLN